MLLEDERCVVAEKVEGRMGVVGLGCASVNCLVAAAVRRGSCRANTENWEALLEERTRDFNNDEDVLVLVLESSDARAADPNDDMRLDLYIYSGICPVTTRSLLDSFGS